MSFADALARAARHNPAWKVATLYRSNPAGTYRQEDGGSLRFAPTRTVRAVVDSRPREEPRDLVQGHDVTTHRLILNVPALEADEVMAEVGGVWFGLRRAVGGDAFGATVTVDAYLADAALIPV